MGVFKKFIGGLALESLATANFPSSITTSTAFNVIPHKWCTGSNKTTITPGSYVYALRCASPYSQLTAIATTDTLDNYSIDDYLLLDTAVGTTTQTISQIIENYTASEIYTITILNSTAQAITVNCIKFRKKTKDDTDFSNNILVCGYYLDSPLTIPAGESRTLSIQLKVGTDVSVSDGGAS